MVLKSLVSYLKTANKRKKMSIFALKYTSNGTHRTGEKVIKAIEKAKVNRVE